MTSLGRGGEERGGVMNFVTTTKSDRLEGLVEISVTSFKDEASKFGLETIFAFGK